MDELRTESRKQTKALKKLLTESKQKAAEPTVPIQDHEQLKDQIDALKTQLTG